MQTVSRFSEIDRSPNVKARLRLSKVSILGYFFNTACLKLFGFCIWDSIRSIETIKKDRSTIRLSTRGCTDLNMITSMLVCVQGLSLYQSSRLSLEKKRRKEIKLSYFVCLRLLRRVKMSTGNSNTLWHWLYCVICTENEKLSRTWSWTWMSAHICNLVSMFFNHVILV